MSNQIFIDTSFFKALMDTDDDFYLHAIKKWKLLSQDDREFVTSNFIIDECATLFLYKSSKKTALLFKKCLLEESEVIQVNRVTIQDEVEGWSIFEKKSEKLSFTDCVSFAQMKRLDITQALSFDKHFAQVGFNLV